MGKSFKMSVEEVKAALIASGYSISGENRNGNNLATVLNLANGCIVNCWDSGKVNLQGKCTSEVEAPSTSNEAYWNGDHYWLSSGETSERFIVSTIKTITDKCIACYCIKYRAMCILLKNTDIVLNKVV